MFKVHNYKPCSYPSLDVRSWWHHYLGCFPTSSHIGAATKIYSESSNYLLSLSEYSDQWAKNPTSSKSLIKSYRILNLAFITVNIQSKSSPDLFPLIITCPLATAIALILYRTVFSIPSPCPSSLKATHFPLLSIFSQVFLPYIP